MSDSSIDYLDDPNFKLTFVNQKSHDRVLKIINSIKSSLQCPEINIDPAPFKVASKISQDPVLILNADFCQEDETKPDEETNDIPQDANLNLNTQVPIIQNQEKSAFHISPITSLKPFILNSVPIKTNVQTDPTYEEARQEIFTQSCVEQHRLLWAFQDRLFYDLLHENDNPLLHSQTELALGQIAKDQMLQIDQYQQKNPISTMMNNTQKQAITLINNQKGRAKLLSEQKLFDIQNKSESVNDPELSISIKNPFGFLTNLNVSKA